MGTEGVSVNPIEELDAMRKIAEAISNLSEPAMRRVCTGRLMYTSLKVLHRQKPWSVRQNLLAEASLKT